MDKCVVLNFVGIVLLTIISLSGLLTLTYFNRQYSVNVVELDICNSSLCSCLSVPYCPQNSIRYRHSCYLIPREKVVLKDAKGLCEQYLGVDSFSFNAADLDFAKWFIQRHARSSVWIDTALLMWSSSGTRHVFIPNNDKKCELCQLHLIVNGPKGGLVYDIQDKEFKTVSVETSENQLNQVICVIGVSSTKC